MTQPTPENSYAQASRRIVGILFILLPLVIVLVFGLWEETARPWIHPHDLDGELMPLPSLIKRAAQGMINNIVPALPLVLGGMWLYAQQISVRCLVFNAIALTSFGILLIGMFVRYSFAPVNLVSGHFTTLQGILLFGFLPTVCLSALLLFLGKKRYVWLCALLPLAILSSILLILGSAYF